MAILLSYPQDIYVAIVEYWYRELGPGRATPEFSRSHGSRSRSTSPLGAMTVAAGGRVARQFVIDLMAKQLLDPEGISCR